MTRGRGGSGAEVSVNHQDDMVMSMSGKEDFN